MAKACGRSGWMSWSGAVGLAFMAAGLAWATTGSADTLVAPLSRAQKFAEQLSLPFPLWVDPERIAYRAAGLLSLRWFDVFSPHLVRAYFAAYARGARQGKLSSHPLQLGGSFVFGPGGEEWFARLSDDPSKNASPQEITDAIADRLQETK